MRTARVYKQNSSSQNWSVCDWSVCDALNLLFLCIRLLFQCHDCVLLIESGRIRWYLPFFFVLPK